MCCLLIIYNYLSSILQQFPLESIDPSLAIGFYCRDKSKQACVSVSFSCSLVVMFRITENDVNFSNLLGDFDDFCIRASKLADQSNGAPLFTVTQTRKLPYFVSHHDNINDNSGFPEPGSSDGVPEGESQGCAHEDDWQLL